MPRTLKEMYEQFEEFRYEMDPGCVSEECSEAMSELADWLEERVLEQET